MCTVDDIEMKGAVRLGIEPAQLNGGVAHRPRKDTARHNVGGGGRPVPITPGAAYAVPRGLGKIKEGKALGGRGGGFYEVRAVVKVQGGDLRVRVRKEARRTAGGAEEDGERDRTLRVTAHDALNDCGDSVNAGG